MAHTTAEVSKHFNLAYRHNVCGVCGCSRYYAGLIETECELRGERHMWTYRDAAPSKMERRAGHHDALVEAIKDCERDARVAFMSNQPKKYLEAILLNTRAVLAQIAAKEE